MSKQLPNKKPAANRPIQAGSTHYSILSTPIGALGVHIVNNHLTKLDFAAQTTQQHPTASPHPLLEHIQQELQLYFANPQHTFNIPVHVTGTAFQKNVWQKLSEIKPGTTASYLDVAKLLKTSPRAVGNACRHNPIPIIVPCHRVVAKTHIGGFAGKHDGSLIDIKKWLLSHESTNN